jgi:hypothetical protein
MRGRRVILPLLLLLAGCTPWAVKDEHRLKVVAPSTVAVGAVYTFSVEITDGTGQPTKNMNYGWLIDWPQARGISHTGVSFEPQQMAVKGGAGKALLRVYVHDEKGRMTQVDRFEFMVE